jgi:hypothetical protein
MTRIILASAVLMLMGCPGTHEQPCSSMMPCPPGQVCDRAVGGSFCSPACSLETDGGFCDDGSVCASYGGPFACRRGGTVNEGEVVGIGGETCARGLAPARDYTVDPAGIPPRVVTRCGRRCERNSECREGESCRQDGVCGPACDGIGCAPEQFCVSYPGGKDYCVDARRYARIDCDGDGDADCWPYLQCDPEAVGGCEHPPVDEI